MDLVKVTGSAPIIVLLIAAILAVLTFYIASRYQVAGADEAIVVAGQRGSRIKDTTGNVVTTQDDGIKVVVGGGVIVRPLLDKSGVIKLAARQVTLDLHEGAVTKQGIKVSVDAVATFKVGRDAASIRAAAERFLHKEDEMAPIVQNVLEGSLRSIVGRLTIEQLLTDRHALQEQVQEQARADLATTGIVIDALTVKSIRDLPVAGTESYIDLMGRIERARVQQEAEVAQAQAAQVISRAQAEASKVRIQTDQEVKVRDAEALIEIERANARANQAGPLAEAEAQQEVVRRQTELADLEAQRTERALLSTVVRPAQAERDATVARAEGERDARIRAAEAEARQVTLRAEAEATATKTRADAGAHQVRAAAEAEAHKVTVEGTAEASRVEAVGKAEGAAILAKGTSEAEAMQKRAAAFKEYNEAAVTQLVIDALPRIVEAAAKPIGSIDNLTVVSTDGASEIVKTGTRTITEADAILKGLTGTGVAALLGAALGRRGGTDEGGEA